MRAILIPEISLRTLDSLGGAGWNQSCGNSNNGFTPSPYFSIIGNLGSLALTLIPRTLVTLCPSPSTTRMLESQRFQNVRLWPRGVDLAQFGPSKRSMALRASWGVGYAPRAQNVVRSKLKPIDTGLHWQGRKASMPMTPPMTPEVVAFSAPAEGLGSGAGGVDEPTSYDHELEERVVLLYVGRM